MRGWISVLDASPARAAAQKSLKLPGEKQPVYASELAAILPEWPYET